MEAYKEHQALLAKVREAMRAKFGKGNYKIAGTYLTETIHARGVGGWSVYASSVDEAAFLLGVE